MAEPRRSFTEEYKRGLVARYQAGDEPSVAQFAKPFEIHEMLFRAWVKQYGDPKIEGRYPMPAVAAAIRNAHAPRSDGQRSNSNYPDDFRARAVKAVKAAMMQENVSLNQATHMVANELHVHHTTVRDWVVKAAMGKSRKAVARAKEREARKAAQSAQEAPPQASNGHLVEHRQPQQTGVSVVVAEFMSERGRIFQNVNPEVAGYIHRLEDEVIRLNSERDIGIRFGGMLANERERGRR